MKSLIIDRLIQIEENAAKISQEAELKTRELPVMVQKKCEEIEAELKLQFENEKQIIKSQKEKETAAQVAAIKGEIDLRYTKLESYYNQNHAQWEEEIFNTIIGSDN